MVFLARGRISRRFNLLNNYIIRKATVMIKLIMRCRWATVILLVTLLALLGCWLIQSPAYDQDLHHFRRSRDLKYYLNAIKVLIQPDTACTGNVLILTLVHSSWSNIKQRQAIRDTWGKHMTTYFVLGVEQEQVKRPLKIYFEAAQHNDLLVFDMTEHYQNLTIKTMVMLNWAQEQCSQAHFVFKTDDDVLVNPYMIDAVVQQNHKAELIGHRITQLTPYRSEHDKWFLPRWLLDEEPIPEFLLGPGYIVRGDIITDILEAAKKVPLINLEDIYLTYLVCESALRMDLVHDGRMSGYFRPWLPIDCAYWTYASMHSFTPNKMRSAWRGIQKKKKQAEHREVCRVFNNVMYFISFFVFIY